MCKRGNYFIAMYDKQDNNIRDFDSIEDCAIYFNTNIKTISRNIHELRRIRNEFLLLKINDDFDPIYNLSKISQERTR